MGQGKAPDPIGGKATYAHRDLRSKTLASPEAINTLVHSIPLYGSPTHNIKGGWWLSLDKDLGTNVRIRNCLVHRHTTITGVPVAWTPKPRLCHADKNLGTQVRIRSSLLATLDASPARPPALEEGEATKITAGSEGTRDPGAWAPGDQYCRI